MALRFCDSQDYYTDDDAVYPSSTPPNGTIGTTSPAPPHGTNRLGGANLAIYWSNVAAYASGEVHFWYYKSSGSGYNFLTIYDPAGTSNSHIVFSILASGAIEVTRAPSTSLGTSAGGVVLNATWQHFRVAWTISNTVGVVQVWVDGVQVINLSSQDTQNSNSASWQTLMVGSTGSINAYIKDLIVLDSDTSDATNDVTSITGVTKIHTSFPNGAGANTDWTPSSGSNYATVDENPPNSDTDYVETTGANNDDSYAFPTTGISGTIYGVQVSLFAKKTDAGSRTLAPLTRVSGTDYAGGTKTLAIAYRYLTHMWAENPNTAAAWDATGVNNAEFGQRLIS